MTEERAPTLRALSGLWCAATIGVVTLIDVFHMVSLHATDRSGRKRESRFLSAACLAAGAIALASCSNPMQTGSEKSEERQLAMKPDEVLRQMYDLYQKTVDHLGQPGWDPVPVDGNADGQIPEGCPLSDGTKGVQYSTSLRGPGQRDPLAAAENVATFWRSRGLRTEAQVPDNPKNPRMIAEGDSDAIGAQYMVDGVRASMTLITTCVPGDEKRLHEKVVQNRSASPLPPSE